MKALIFLALGASFAVGCGRPRAKMIFDEDGRGWRVAECKRHPNVCLEIAGSQCRDGYTVMSGNAQESSERGLMYFRCR